jgi:signal transduction histidine kinase
MIRRDETPLILEGHPGGDNGWMLDTTAYLTLAGGYLIAIITSTNLTLLGFLLLTASNIAWLYCFRRMAYSEQTVVEIFLLAAAMIALTVAASQLVRLGLGFDWLLPLVTIGFFMACLEPKVAITLSLATWLLVSLSLLNLDGGWTTYFSQSELSLLPAAIFTFAFTWVVRQQYTERRRAEQLVEQLEEVQQQLRRYAGEVEELTVTRERNAMAREIHDTLGHYLTILAVKLETATKLEERADHRLHAELVDARRVASECLAEVRRAVAALRPASSTAIELNEGLARLVAEFETIAPETQVTLDAEGPTSDLGAEVRLALYRSAQESLTNIRKHARASKVLVRLRVGASRAELLVRDNGVGAEREAQEPGFGLLGMRERIALLGGAVSAGPDAEQGWRVEVSLPLPPSATAASAPEGRKDMVTTATSGTEA